MAELTRAEVIAKLQQWQQKLATDVQDSIKFAAECQHEPGKQQYARSAAMAQRGVDLLECTLQYLAEPSLKTIIERVRATLAAHIGKTLTALEAGIIEVEIIQSIVAPKGEDKPNG